MATNYDINYDDKRFTGVESDKDAALKESNEMYDGMISDTDSYYQAQINASKEYAETQKENQQANTDFAIQEINQQKAQAENDYTKEQAGAWADYKKQIDPYGAQAEQVAASGLSNSGYADSLKTQAFVAYQNRYATARESYQRAVLNYNNAITQARLQNNAALAEIAYQALQQQLELSLAGFQYKNTLLLDKAATKREIDNTYYSRYQDVLKQINTENTLKEQVRQYNEQMALSREQFEWQKAQAEKSSIDSGIITKSPSGKKTVSSSQAKAINDALIGKKAPANNTSDVDAETYINALIASGATKDQVANEIALALREGAIDTKTATQLRNKFTPRGVQY